MKTLQINTRETGGAGIACLRLHNALTKSNIDSSVLVLEKESSQLANILPYWEKAYGGGMRTKIAKQLHILDRKLKWRKLNSRKKGYEAFSFANNPSNILQHPATQTTDIINLHWVSWWLDYTSFFQTDKPVVWTLHDKSPFAYGVPYDFGFPFSAYTDLIKRNKRIAHDALRNKSIHIVTLNQWMHDLSKNSPLFGDFEHTIIPNSIDTTVFKPHDKTDIRIALGIPNDAPMLLFVAADIANKRKGLDLLFGALQQFQATPLYVVAVGKQMEATPSIGKHQFIQLGSIYDAAELAQVYAAADFYVIPSREDNLPNTVLESLACGTPVIGYSIGGIPDMICNKQLGLLSAEVSAAALADTIKQALQYSFNRQYIRQNAVKRYAPKVQAKNYIQLYNRAIYE